MIIPRCLAAVLAAALSMSFLPPSALSADLPAERPLTLKECIEYALEHHNSVLAAERDVVGSRASVVRARSGFYPRVSLGTDYSRGGYEGNQVGSGLRRTGTFDSTQTVVGLSQTIWDGGRTLASVRQASASARAAMADEELTRQERILSVTEAYFDVLLANRLADIAAQTVRQSEEQLELIKARVDAGDAAPVDVYPVDVQLANAKLSKLQADNNARIAMNSLRNAVGLEHGPPLRLADVQEPSIQMPTLTECFERAFRDRPEIHRSNAQVDSAKAALTLARSQTVPVPTASASYDRGIAGTGFTSQWSIGVGLSMNVFDGGAARSDVTRARAQLDSADLRADQTRRDIAAEVESAYLELANALERLAASRPNVELARKNLEIAQARYEQGLAIPLEIVSAQVSYADAQAQNALALYDCYVSQARLDKAVGKRGY